MICTFILFCVTGRFVVHAEVLSYLPYEGASYELFYEVSNDGITITGYTGTVTGEFVLPEEIDGINVVAIGDNAFKSCDNISGTLTIPDNITSIGKYAFANCNKIIEIRTGDGITVINPNAFNMCDSLISVSLGKGVQEFYNAFNGCFNLKSIVVVEENILYKSIDNIVFSKDGTVIKYSPCARIGEEYIVPEGVISIENYAFYDSDNLITVIFPDSLTKIGERAFSSCDKLSKIILGAGIEKIGKDAFSNCKELDIIDIDSENPNFIVKDNAIFTKDGTGLVLYFAHKSEWEYTIPEGVTSINARAFNIPSNLHRVIVPDSVIDIDMNAFSGDIEQIYFLGNPPDMDQFVFPYIIIAGIPQWTTIYYPYENELWLEFIDNNEEKYASRYVTFCPYNDESNILSYMASGTYENLKYFLSYNGELIITGEGEMVAGKNFYSYPWAGYRDNIKKIEVCDGVKSISNSAFVSCTGVSDLIIPKSVKIIGSDVLYKYSALTIWGYSGSYAETFAKENNIPFKVLDEEEILPTPKFEDVVAGSYYEQPVQWAVEKGITNGYGSDTIFNPEGTCTRGQIVTFLWRANGSPEPASLDNPFTDVLDTEYYYKAVLWAVENGITAGYGSDTIFNPDGACTRAQVATFMWRAAGKPDMSSAANPFTDLDAEGFYYDAVLWAVENGITNGYGSADTFCPDFTCTRGQIVTFLYRGMN